VMRTVSRIRCMSSPGPDRGAVPLLTAVLISIRIPATELLLTLAIRGLGIWFKCVAFGIPFRCYCAMMLVSRKDMRRGERVDARASHLCSTSNIYLHQINDLWQELLRINRNVGPRQKCGMVDVDRRRRTQLPVCADQFETGQVFESCESIVWRM
jgi:hypothetical protein